MDKMIFEFAKLYGNTLLLLALSGIFILGVLKFFKVFDKIEKSKRKYIYAGISAGLSIIASVCYLAYNGSLTATMVLALCPAIYMLNQSAYAVYENFGIRNGLAKVGVMILTIVAQGKMQELGLIEKPEKPDKEVSAEVPTAPVQAQTEAPHPLEPKKIVIPIKK